MPSATTPDPRARRGAACPVCGAAPTPAHRPFCGPRCRDRDLLQWLGEGHRIPGRPVADDEAESPPGGLDS